MFDESEMGYTTLDAKCQYPSTALSLIRIDVDILLSLHKLPNQVSLNLTRPKEIVFFIF